MLTDIMERTNSVAARHYEDNLFEDLKRHEGAGLAQFIDASSTAIMVPQGCWGQTTAH